MRRRTPHLDSPIDKYYGEGHERERLQAYRLERDRTLAILRKHLPSPPATIFDVGGAAGVYAFPLAEMGYTVHLIDPVPLHIAQAKEYAKVSGHKLASYSLGDARNIKREDDSADVVLFFGPLYHLIPHKDRLQAIQEAYRVLKPNGKFFAAGIARFAAMMDALHKGTIYSKLPAIEETLVTGVHRKTAEDVIFAYLHHPAELKEEVQKCGFENVVIHAIEGPVWERHLIEALYREEKWWEKLLNLLESIETEETIVGASAHIMAIGHTGNPKKSYKIIP